MRTYRITAYVHVTNAHMPAQVYEVLVIALIADESAQSLTVFLLYAILCVYASYCCFCVVDLSSIAVSSSHMFTLVCVCVLHAFLST